MLRGILFGILALIGPSMAMLGQGSGPDMRCYGDILPGAVSGSSAGCSPYDAPAFTSVEPAQAACSGPGNGQEDCCEGLHGDKISEITFRYSGASCEASDNQQGPQGVKWDCSGDPAGDARVFAIANNRNQPGDLGGSVYFIGEVNIGQEFEVSSELAGQRRLNPNTYIRIYSHPGGELLQFVQIHTSCSSPVVIGDQFGSLVVQSVRFDSGLVCGPGSPGQEIGYQWQQSADGVSWVAIPGATGLTYDPPALETTTFFRRVATACCGSAASNIITVAVNQSPAADAGPDQSTGCGGGQAVLTGSAVGGTPPYGFTWSTGETTATITVAPAVTTTYTLTVTDARGCTASDEVTVSTGGQAFTVDIPRQEICRNAQALLVALPQGGTPPYSYLWDNGLGAGQVHSVSPDSSTVYTVLVTDASGCTATATTEVVVFDNPVADAGADISRCTAGPVTLTATAQFGQAPYTYYWYGLGPGDSATVNPDRNTLYIVEVTDANGCTDRDAVVVYVGGNLTVIAQGGGICAGDTFMLTGLATGGTPPYLYIWSNGDTGSTAFVSPATTTVFTLEVADAAGCTGSAAATVTVSPRPSLATDSVYCSPAGNTYSVVFSASGGEIAVSPGVPVSLGGGVYEVTGIPVSGALEVSVTAGPGCSETLSIDPPQCPCLPPAPPAVPDTVFACAGQAVPVLVALAGPGLATDWYGSATGVDLLAAGTTSYQPQGGGTFWVEARDEVGLCVSTRVPVTVTVVDCRDCPLPDCLPLEGAR